MEEIINLRNLINEIDEKILDLINERISLAKKIGVVKKQNGIEIVDKEREQEILINLTAKANEKGIDPEIVKKVWGILIVTSYKEEG